MGVRVGGGKSDCVIVKPLRWIDRSSFRGLILRGSWPQLQDLIDRAKELYLRLPGMGDANWRASENRFVFPSGASIRFGHCATWEDVQRYQGHQYQYIAYDEVGNLREERCWVFLFSCCRSPRDPEIVCQCVATANPGGAGHGWVRRRFIEQCPPNGDAVWFDLADAGEEPEWVTRAFFQAKVTDNPTILRNDRAYIARLKALPEIQRKQHLDGDWTVGEGIAFPTLTHESHMLAVPVRPEHTWFGAFDWGYGHQWSFGLFRNIHGQRVHVADHIWGRRHTPAEIAERVADGLRSHGLTFQSLQYTVAGADVKIREEARGSFGPSVMEQFGQVGWVLMRGDPARIAGYQNALRYVQDGLVSFEPTKGNRVMVNVLMDMALDPDSPNDVLKKDYDPVNDTMGDDAYDMFKMALMSRPLAISAPPPSVERDHHRGIARYLTAKPVPHGPTVGRITRPEHQIR